MLARWDERIRRARDLSSRHGAASALLTFYADLAGYQRSLAERWTSATVDQPLANTLSSSLNTSLVLDAVPEFLSWLERAAPAHVTAALENFDRPGRLDGYLTDLQADAAVDPSPEAFVLEALLQPLAELHAAGGAALATCSAEALASAEVAPATYPSLCPFCKSLPVVGVLREEGEGAKRSLVCGLCATEWRHPRIVCPSCGESKFDALAAYTAEQIPDARIDACDTCRVYLKTIDMTKDGLAVPLVDDLASVSLDLWAREQGYVRLRPNLLRT